MRKLLKIHAVSLPEAKRQQGRKFHETCRICICICRAGAAIRRTR